MCLHSSTTMPNQCCCCVQAKACSKLQTHTNMLGRLHRLLADGCQAVLQCLLLLPPPASGSGTHHLLHALPAADGGGELAGLVQAGAQQTRDLLDDRLRGQEGVVALSCGHTWGRRGLGGKQGSATCCCWRNKVAWTLAATAQQGGGWMHACRTTGHPLLLGCAPTRCIRVPSAILVH